MSAIASFMGNFDSRSSGPRIRKRGAKQHLDPIDVALADAKRRAASGDWDAASGATFVGLYALCHSMVYGVTPDELRNTVTMRAAARAAKNLLHSTFVDDGEQMAQFVRWCWEREKRKHEWARSRGVERLRLGVKFQFSPAMVTDYRVECASRARR